MKLAHATCAAEFPEFQAWLCFAPFDLSTDAAFNQNSTRLERLAGMFGHDLRDFKDQFLDLRAAALEIKRPPATQISSYEAWRQALIRSPTRGNAEAHPISMLFKPFYHYGLFCGCSTSVVERTFVGKSRSHLSESRGNEQNKRWTSYIENPKHLPTKH